MTGSPLARAGIGDHIKIFLVFGRECAREEVREEKDVFLSCFWIRSRKSRKREMLGGFVNVGFPFLLDEWTDKEAPQYK